MKRENLASSEWPGGPPSPSLEQLKKQAKSLLKRQQAADSEALTRIRENHPRWRSLLEEQVAASPFALADAQLVIASEYGFASWSKLQAHVKKPEAASSTAAARARRQSQHPPRR